MAQVGGGKHKKNYKETNSKRKDYLIFQRTKTNFHGNKSS